MPNILSKLLPALASNDAVARIAELKQRHTLANEAATAARQHYEDTLGSAVAGECPMADADAARAALTVAEQAAAVLGDAATLAEDLHARAQAAAVIDKAWDKTVAASRRREKIAARLQSQLADVAATFAELRAANAEVHGALPVGYPFHAAAGFGIESDLAPSLVRVEYSRRGLPGGPPLMVEIGRAHV